MVACPCTANILLAQAVDAIGLRQRLQHSKPIFQPGLGLQVLLLSMLAPRSYTSEDVIELHCHGGSVCVQRVLGCCLRAGARLAKPGEFTLRAFLNGRLDLSQVLSLLLQALRQASCSVGLILGGSS